MTSKELNTKLICEFPELCEKYDEETSWQDGDETGAHVIYADVFVPFIKKQVLEKNEHLLHRVFAFIELLLELHDAYADEVIALSVLESLIYDDEIENIIFIPYAKDNALEIINEILQEKM